MCLLYLIIFLYVFASIFFQKLRTSVYGNSNYVILFVVILFLFLFLFFLLDMVHSRSFVQITEQNVSQIDVIMRNPKNKTVTHDIYEWEITHF